MDNRHLESRIATIIGPAKGWSGLDLHELWEYRDLLWFMLLRNIKGRYRQTALGPLWIILKPLGSMVIFTFIFGTLAKMPSDGLPYPLFSYSGLLSWSYFAGAVGSASSSLTDNMYLISKVYFPRLVVPLVGIFTGVVDLVVSLGILFILILLYGYTPNLSILLLPFYLLFAALLALGFGLWNAALVVRYRDWGIVVGYIIQFWMYLTPIAYASSVIPSQFILLYKLNPMYWVVEGFRRGLIGTGAAPEPLMLIPVLGVLALVVSGLYVFRRTEMNVVDWL